MLSLFESLIHFTDSFSTKGGSGGTGNGTDGRKSGRSFSKPSIKLPRRRSADETKKNFTCGSRMKRLLTDCSKQTTARKQNVYHSRGDVDAKRPCNPVFVCCFICPVVR